MSIDCAACLCPRGIVALIAVLIATVFVGCDTNASRRADCDKMQQLKAEYLRTGDPTALHAIESYITGNNSFRRTYAISTLGEIGPAAISSAPLIIAALSGNDRFAAREAALALGPITKGTDVAVSALQAAVNRRAADASWFAAESLGEIGEPAKAAVPDLIKAAESSDEILVSHAKKALKKLGHQ